MFDIDSNQARVISDWKENHECAIEHTGACGGQYTYMFTPTSLGVVSVVKCVCGSEINVTEYESW